MTHPELVKIENLVRRLEEAMEGGEEGIEKTLFSLAAEYAEHCKRANDRLQICAEIASKGKEMEYQALMAATRAPDLLDLCAVLSELQTDEWRSFCRTRHLPVPDQLMESAKQLIDPIYARAGSFQRKLMEEYSAANSKRDFREALKVIRHAAKLNPGDASSSVQAQRLEDRLVREVVKSMEAPLRGGDVAAILEKLEDIESLAPGRLPKEGEASEVLWSEALELRRGVRREEAMEEASELMAEAEVSWRAGELDEVLDLISRVSALMEEHDFTLRAEIRALHAEIGVWADEEVSKIKIEDRFRAKLKQLSETMRVIRDKELQSTKPTLEEYREDSFLMQRQWKEISEFRKPVPAELQSEAQKLAGELEERISLLEAAKRRNLILAVTAASIVLVASAVLAIFFWKAVQTRALLSRSVEERRANDLERKISELESEKPIWFAFSGLPGEVERGKSWLGLEKAGAAVVADLINALDLEVRSKEGADSWTSSSLASMKGRIAEARSEMEGVNDEYRSDMAGVLASVDRDWRRLVDGKRNAIVADFHEKVGLLEVKIRDELGFDQPTARLNRSVSETAALITEMDAMEQVELEELKPSTADLTKYELLKGRFAAIEEKANQAGSVMAACREASNLDDYMKAMKELGESGALEGSQKLAHMKLLLKVRSEDSVLSEILAPGDVPFWTRLKKPGNYSSQGYPDSIEGEETVAFLTLRDDEHLGEMHQYTVAESGKSRTIYSLAGGMKVNTSRIGDIETTEASGDKVFDPARAASQTVAFAPSNYQHRRTPGGGSGALVRDGKRTPEFELYSRIRLAGFVDPSVSSFRDTLLKAVDRILESGGEVNPVYKAYLHLKIGEIVMTRREKWLVEFTDFEEDLFELKGIVDRELTSTDWLVPAIVEDYREALNAYYEKHRGTQYAKTGIAVYQFYQRMMGAGLGFCGFVDAKGGVELSNSTGKEEVLWGCDTDLNITRIFRKNSEGEWEALVEASPFSPVFQLKASHEEVLRQISEAYNTDVTAPDVRKKLPATLLAETK